MLLSKKPQRVCSESIIPFNRSYKFNFFPVQVIAEWQSLCCVGQQACNTQLSRSALKQQGQKGSRVGVGKRIHLKSWCRGTEICIQWVVRGTICTKIFIFNGTATSIERKNGVMQTLKAMMSSGWKLDFNGSHRQQKKNISSPVMALYCDMHPWLPFWHTSWREKWIQSPQDPHIWGWALWVCRSAFWQSSRKPGPGWRAPFWKVTGLVWQFVVKVVGGGGNKKKEEYLERQKGRRQEVFVQ